MAGRQTPSQTIGPFFAYGLTAEQYGYRHGQIAGAAIAGEAEDGERIRLVGRVFDGEGQAVNDAMLEIWQADAQGRYAHPADRRGSNLGFRGFGRVGTGADPECLFAVNTIKPGSVDGRQAPHLTLILTMRGLLNHCYTRVYFADEADANARDPVLAAVPEDRRGTLIAAREETQQGPVYRFDIHMQGERETVFFDL